MFTVIAHFIYILMFYIKCKSKHAYWCNKKLSVWFVHLYPDYLGRDVRKPVFGVYDKVRFKPVSSSTETIKKIEISPVASLNMIFSKKRITEALIRLRGCADWSVPVLFANPQRQVFSRRGPSSPC